MHVYLQKIHNPWVESTFSAVYTRWSHVFRWEFALMAEELIDWFRSIYIFFWSNQSQLLSLRTVKVDTIFVFNVLCSPRCLDARSCLLLTPISCALSLQNCVFSLIYAPRKLVSFAVLTNETLFLTIDKKNFLSLSTIMHRNIDQSRKYIFNPWISLLYSISNMLAWLQVDMFHRRSCTPVADDFWYPLYLFYLL